MQPRHSPSGQGPILRNEPNFSFFGSSQLSHHFPKRTQFHPRRLLGIPAKPVLCSDSSPLAVFAERTQFRHPAHPPAGRPAIWPKEANWRNEANFSFFGPSARCGLAMQSQPELDSLLRLC